jgi:cell division protein ZapA (FtsZ GTPase activity inhibitor)
MERRTVQLRVGGAQYRVVTTAGDGELRQCVGVLEEKLAQVTPPGRTVTPQSMVLAALALVNELEAERERSRRLELRTREVLARLLERVDAALEDETPAPPPAAAPSP